MMMNFLTKYRDFGLLILRAGVGIDFLLIHGWRKITAEPERLQQIGAFMPSFGIEEIQIFWGLCAALTETVGAILFAAGLFYRPVCALLGFTMLVAVYAHLSTGDSWGATSHALQLVFVFFGLMFTEPGKYSLDNWIKNRRK